MHSVLSASNRRRACLSAPLCVCMGCCVGRFYSGKTRLIMSGKLACSGESADASMCISIDVCISALMYVRMVVCGVCHVCVYSYVFIFLFSVTFTPTLSHLHSHSHPHPRTSIQHTPMHTTRARLNVHPHTQPTTTPPPTTYIQTYIKNHCTYTRMRAHRRQLAMVPSRPPHT